MIIPLYPNYIPTVKHVYTYIYIHIVYIYIFIHVYIPTMHMQIHKYINKYIIYIYWHYIYIYVHTEYIYIIYCICHWHPMSNNNKASHWEIIWTPGNPIKSYVAQGRLGHRQRGTRRRRGHSACGLGGGRATRPTAGPGQSQGRDHGDWGFHQSVNSESNFCETRDI